MTLGIRTKLVGTLILAGLLPLALFLTVILTGALSVRTNSIGSAFRTHARLQADHLVALVSSQTEFVWMLGHMPEPREMLRAANERPFDQEGTDALEERWPSLSPDAPELQAILDNDVARQWQSIQSQQPRFAEVLITDLKGRLVAATNKTSDSTRRMSPGGTTPTRTGTAGSC
jgi:hypothetical protein